MHISENAQYKNVEPIYERINKVNNLYEKGITSSYTLLEGQILV